MQTTSNWGDFVKGVSAQIDEIIDETKDFAPSFMETGLWKKEQSDGLIFRTEGVTGLNLLEGKDEAGNLKTDRTYPAYKTEYVMEEKGKIVEISQLLSRTRPSELETKLDEVKQLRMSAESTLNEHAWQTLKNAFVMTDGYQLARLNDGVPMCSTAHLSRVDGIANRSNRVAGNPVYDGTSQWTAIKMLKEMLNGRGLPISPKGNFVVVVPTALEKLAVETNNSVKRAGTPNNDINYYEGIVDVVATNLIGALNGGSDTAFFVFHKSALANAMRFVSLIDPKIEHTVDFKSKAINVSIDVAYAFGYSNFEHMVGSDGTGS